MDLLAKVDRGIAKIKKDRDEWIRRYQDLVETFKDSIYKEISEIERFLEEYSKKTSEKIENQRNEISSINEKLKSIEQKQHLIDRYKESLEEDLDKLDDIFRKLDDLYIKNDASKNEINKIEEFLKEYSKQTNKNIENLEKKLNETSTLSKNNSVKLEKQDSDFSNIKFHISSIKERLKLIEEKLDKHDNMFNEINSNIKDFKKYIIDFINEMTREYEKRFEKFKARYDEVMSISNNLKTEIKKTNSMYSDFEKSMRRIFLIENKLDKLETNLNMVEKRMNVFKKEKQIIVDKFYSLKDNQTKQLKELEDSLVLLSADINRLKIKQAKLESD